MGVSLVCKRWTLIICSSVNLSCWIGPGINSAALTQRTSLFSEVLLDVKSRFRIFLNGTCNLN